MYASTDDRTFIKCLNNDFTVIPFAIFFLKMVGVILYAHSALTNELIFECYIFLCFLTILLKVLIIVIRKINILDSPITEKEVKKAKIDSNISLLNS